MNSDEPVQLPRRDFYQKEDEGDKIDRLYDRIRDEEITKNIEGEECEKEST